MLTVFFGLIIFKATYRHNLEMTAKILAGEDSWWGGGRNSREGKTAKLILDLLTYSHPL